MSSSCRSNSANPARFNKSEFLRQLNVNHNFLFLFQDAKRRELLEVMIHGVKARCKYPASVREFCIKMSGQSSLAYDNLRSTFNKNLPDKSTIRGWYANSYQNSPPGINHEILKVLGNKASEKKSKGSELICSLVVDEMSIRQHAQWCNSSKTVLGYPTYGRDKSDDTLAKQVIVFMLVGVNERLQSAMAYHFIASLDGAQRSEMLKEVITAVATCGITVLNVTFDGLRANQAMCERLGANMTLSSATFQPYICLSDQKTYILKDPPHMIKLVRNVFGTKRIIYDRQGGKIEWAYIEKLVEFGKSRDFNLMHKLNQKHIQWKRNIMKVDLAVQTLSASAAGSIDFLMNNGETDFLGAAPTIRFLSIFDRIFDVFNTKYDDSSEVNVFKRALNPENRIVVFALFEEAIEYIEGLKIAHPEDSTKKILITRSKSQTGFNGFISNMHVVKLIYREYVEQKHLLACIQTYRLGQDHLEMFFGRCRALNGHNDNPTVQQFHAAFRKLLVFDTLLSSKYSNCAEIDIPNQPLGNILYVSSRQKKGTHETEDVTPADLETLHQKLAEIEAIEQNCLIDSHKDYTIAYIGRIIENRIECDSKIWCNYCKNIFKENAKKTNVYVGSKLKEFPCQSTFEICKAADRFLKLKILSEETDFSKIYAGISSCLDLGNLFPATDFSHDFEHKLYFVKAIVDVYIYKSEALFGQKH